MRLGLVRCMGWVAIGIGSRTWGSDCLVWFDSVGEWLEVKRKAVLEDDWDDVNVVTGREGKGKSKWARKVARKLDSTFTLERIHFEWDSYAKQSTELKPGQAIVLDEFRGHSRESMTGERMSVLDEFKENRGLNLHHFIVFNKFTKLDKDLVTDRVSDWSYVRHRGRVEVRRPKTELVFDSFGVPSEPTTYPLVAHFDFSDWEPPGWAAGYKAIKQARMRDRKARLRGEEHDLGPVVTGDMLREVRARLGR